MSKDILVLMHRFLKAMYGDNHAPYEWSFKAQDAFEELIEAIDKAVNGES